MILSTNFQKLNKSMLMRSGKVLPVFTLIYLLLMGNSVLAQVPVSPLNKHKLNWTAVLNKPSLASSASGVTVLYSKKDSELSLLANGVETLVNEDAPKDMTPDSHMLLSHGEKLITLWKELYREENAPVGHMLKIRISNDSGATLGRSKVIAVSKGGPIVYVEAKQDADSVYVVWADTSKETSGIYLTSSKDFGETWHTVKVPLTKIVTEKVVASGTEGKEETKEITQGAPRLFHLEVENNTARVYWVAPNEKNDGVVIRDTQTQDGGATWTKPETIAAAYVINQFVPISHDKSTFLLWTGQEVQERTVYTVNGVKRDVAGTWKAIKTHPTLFSAYDFKLNVASSKKFDHILVASSYRPTVGSVEQTYVMRYDMSKDTWTDPLVLPVKKPNFTTSILPEMAYTPDGDVTVWWTDFRNVRGNIYARSSHDMGKTWEAGDVQITPAASNARVYKLIWNPDHTISGYWIETSDGNIRDTSMVLKRFTSTNQLKEVAIQDMDKNKIEERLRERIALFWAARSKGNAQEDYALLDPITRANIPVMSYTYRVKTNIHKYEIEKIKIEGNFALVDVAYNYSISAGSIAPSSEETPPKDDNVTMRWVWMDNDWYRVYDPNKNVSFIQYYPE